MVSDDKITERIESSAKYARHGARVLQLYNMNLTDAPDKIWTYPVFKGINLQNNELEQLATSHRSSHSSSAVESCR